MHRMSPIVTQIFFLGGGSGGFFLNQDLIKFCALKDVETKASPGSE